MLGISQSEVEIGVLFTERSRKIPAKTVVFVGFNEPKQRALAVTSGKWTPSHMIGDVRGKNSILTAIHAGMNLAGVSDSENPDCGATTQAGAHSS